jgi:predicted Zn-dependent peptidase
MQIALYDLPDDYFTDFVPRMSRLTADDVTRVAAAHLDPSRVMTLIVGDPSTITSDRTRVDLGEFAILPPEPF